MSVPSHPPNKRVTIDELARQVAGLDERLRQGLPHRLEHHEDVDLQGAAETSALVRGAGAIWGPGSAGGGPSVAYLNNSDGSIGGIAGDYQQWNQLATLGDTSWFEFPTDYWGPNDRAAFRFVQPGIFTVIARVTGGGLTSVDITAGGNGSIANRGIDGPYDALCGSGTFVAEQVEPGDYEVLLIQTTGAVPAFSQVAIAFWPGEPAYTLFP